MNKELEQLQKIASFKVDKIYDVKFDNDDRKHYECESIRDLFPNEFIEIETALKRLNDLQQMLYKMNVKHGYKEYLKIIKTLEIIKEHFVNIGGTRGNFEGKKPTNEIIIALKDLPQEEFDFLKEVLL